MEKQYNERILVLRLVLLLPLPTKGGIYSILSELRTMFDDANTIGRNVIYVSFGQDDGVKGLLRLIKC